MIRIFGFRVLIYWLIIDSLGQSRGVDCCEVGNWRI